MKKWSEVEKELFTPEQIRESRLRVDIMEEFMKARDEKRITQKEFERLIEKMYEEDEASSQPYNFLKLLAPLGKTLYVGDLQEA